MLDFYYIADYFLSNLEPLQQLFFKPFERDAIVGFLMTISDAGALLGSSMAQFVSDFIRSVEGVPRAYVLLGSGLVFVVVGRCFKFVWDLLPVV